MAQADQGKEFFTQKNIFSSKSDRQRRQLLLNSILIFPLWVGMVNSMRWLVLLTAE